MKKDAGCAVMPAVQVDLRQGCMKETGMASPVVGARPKAWSLRNAYPTPYEPIVRLAKACEHPVACSALMATAALGHGSGLDEESSRLAAVDRLAEPLSPRELQVLSAVCDGDSNEDISRKLAIGIATVKYHVIQIYGKLGVQRRTQAVGVAIHLGLIQSEWLQAATRPIEQNSARSNGEAKSAACA